MINDSETPKTNTNENENTAPSGPPEPGSRKVVRLPAPCWNLWQVLMVMLAAVALAMTPYIFQTEQASQVGLNLLSGMLQDGAFFLFPCLIVLGVYKQPAAMLGMFRISWWRMLVIGIPCGLLFYLLNTLAAMLVELLFPGMIASSQSSMALFGMAENLFDYIMLCFFFCLVAPAAEEMMFRAFIYPPLLLRCGRGPTILISAIVFGAMHLNVWTFLPLFVGGLCFGLLYDKFRNLWLNICAHAAWNTLVVILYLTQ